MSPSPVAPESLSSPKSRRLAALRLSSWLVAAAVAGGAVSARAQSADPSPDGGAGGAARRQSGPPPGPPAPGDGLPWSFGPKGVPQSILNAPQACTASDWLTKYFHYRRRLYGDVAARIPGFVARGTGAGQGLPASKRNPDAYPMWSSDWGHNCRYSPRTMDCTSENNCTPPAWASGTTYRDNGMRGELKWGDSTILLGWYLATLASEWEALRIMSLPRQQTEADLFDALEAFDRLDRAGELVYGKPANLNGFFMRDDVPADLIWRDAAATQPRFRRADAEGYSFIISTANCMESCEQGSDAASFAQCYQDRAKAGLLTDTGAVTSQDQIIGLLPGLAMVVRFVPDGVAVNGKSLRKWARNIADRLARGLSDNGWWVKDPFGKHPSNAWGGDARFFSGGIARSAAFIAAETKADYDRLLKEYAPLPVVGDTWVLGMTPLSSNESMGLKVMTTSDASESKIESIAEAWSAPVYPMMHEFLNRRSSGAVSTMHIEYMLQTAPCGGPCEGSSGCQPTAAEQGWQGQHRFSHPENRLGDWYGYAGEYPGLDYMLLHNLYVIQRGGPHQASWSPAPACAQGSVLEPYVQSGASLVGKTWRPSDECNRADFGRTYCGRTFAAWVDEALAGRATIFTAGARWNCAFGKCEIASSSTGKGTAGTDLFIGSPGNDGFDGQGGSDCLAGGGGDDTLAGGDGIDVIFGGAGQDTLSGGAGPDVIFGEDGGDTIRGDAGHDELHGGPGKDTIEGGDGVDQIAGDAGDDALRGQGGDDQLWGGPGDDAIEGGEGGDRLRGDAGDDRIEGGNGDDLVWAGAGKDTVLGDAGEDTVRAGPGDDRVSGGPGRDQLHGDDGNDLLRGDAGDDSLDGGPGDDRLCGGCDKDAHNCGDGNDRYRAKAYNAAICGVQNDTWDKCEAEASKDDCSDAAFNGW